MRTVLVVLARSVCVLVAISGTLSISAHADTILPPPVTLAHCAVGSNVLDDPSSCTLGTTDTAFASLTLAPFVGLSAEATSPGALGIHGAAAVTVLNYSFQVTGGNAGDIVPIMILTSLNTASVGPTDHAIGFASMTVQTSAAGTTLVAVCTDGTCGTTAKSFSGTLNTRARSGAVGDVVQLQLEASVAGTQQDEFASASADPFIFIDPSFATAGLYHIIVSPGVANAAPVPEPATAVLIIMGGLALAATYARSAKFSASTASQLQEGEPRRRRI